MFTLEIPSLIGKSSSPFIIKITSISRRINRNIHILILINCPLQLLNHPLMLLELSRCPIALKFAKSDTGVIG